MGFGAADKSVIEARVAAFEQATGAQAIVSVVDRSDSYPEVPWRAFALGVALAALCVWLIPFFGAIPQPSTALLMTVVLAAGVAAALITIFLPVTGRWLLPASRCQAETRQYAQVLFLQRELFATRERLAVLLHVSLYEGCAVMIADKGLREQLPAGYVASVETQVRTALRRGNVADAVQSALTALQAQLPAAGYAQVNEIADMVIRERGH
jgi:putative membrane protein